jgi:hypothetical protein
MHENKIIFCFFLCFLKREINLKILDFFWIILEIFQRKLGILILNLYLTV